MDGDQLIPLCGPAPLPEVLATAWTLEPALLMILVLVALAGFPSLRGAAADRRHTLAIALGGSVLVYVSPLCALTVALLAARTLHHIVLIALIAPALALAFPWRRAPMEAAFLALSAALWAWHLPTLYSAAWDSSSVYWAMHLALLGASWAFWSAVLDRRDDLPGVPGAATAATALAAQMGLIGAILVFAPRVPYPEHIVGADGFGIGALADQKLAGLVLWGPGMLPLALVAAWVLRRSWREDRAA